MTAHLVAIVLCVGLTAVGCATKRFVQEQVTATESKLAQKVTATETSLSTRADTQEAKLRETTERTGENRQAIDATTQQLKGLDGRVDDVNARATAATQDAEARMAQRLAGRNRYRLLDTKAVYFDADRIDIRTQDVATLDEVANALAADPNAILELQGYADPRGSDRYNRALARERVEAVMRYLMQRHNIELRQLQGIPMGKVVPAAGEKVTSQAMAEARRVDLRLLTPWSSWEERTERDDAPAALPAQVQQNDAPAALPEQAQQSDAPAPPTMDNASDAQTLPAFLKTLGPRDLGGR